MNYLFLVVALVMVLGAGFVVMKPLVRSSSEHRNSDRTVAMFTLAVLVFGAIGLYAVIGAPDLTARAGITPAAASASMAASAENQRAASVSSLLAGLESRLEQNPLDGKGWLLLAKSYDHLGRSDEARTAYDKASALGATDPGFESTIASAANELPVALVRGRISLADGVAESIEPDSTVFVIATSTDNNPMPVAVLRRLAGDLPFDYVLDESTSMMAGRALSDGEAVYVTARISRSGDALDTSAGMGARAGPVSADGRQAVDLVIDRMSAKQQ